MDHTKSDSLIAIQELEKFYEKLFPYKSEFELWDNLLCNASEKKRVGSFFFEDLTNLWMLYPEF